MPNEFKIISLISNALPKIGCNISTIKTKAIHFKIIFFHFNPFCDRGYKIIKGKKLKKLSILSSPMLFIKSSVKSTDQLNQFIEDS